jgi:hypothetical protein
MGNCEVIGAHLGLQKIGFRDHSIDIYLHDLLHKEFVVQSAVVRILIE